MTKGEVARPRIAKRHHHIRLRSSRHGAQREATATDACIAALSVDELPERYSRAAGPAIWRPGMLVEVMVVAAVPWSGPAGKPHARLDLRPRL